MAVHALEEDPLPVDVEKAVPYFNCSETILGAEGHLLLAGSILLNNHNCI